MQAGGDHRPFVMGEEGQRVHVQRTAVVAAVQVLGDGAAVVGWKPAPGEAQRFLLRPAGDVALHRCTPYGISAASAAKTHFSQRCAVELS